MFIITWKGGLGMQLIRSKMTWFIGIILFSLSLSMFFSFPADQQTQLIKIPAYQNLSVYENHFAILKEPHSNYWAYLTKSFKISVYIAKYLHGADIDRTYLSFWDTQNLNAAILVITLFVMFYRLSRTGGEKTDSHKSQSLLT
jgi:hypothetical protein